MINRFAHVIGNVRRLDLVRVKFICDGQGLILIFVTGCRNACGDHFRARDKIERLPAQFGALAIGEAPKVSLALERSGKVFVAENPAGGEFERPAGNQSDVGEPFALGLAISTSPRAALDISARTPQQGSGSPDIKPKRGHRSAVPPKVMFAPWNRYEPRTIGLPAMAVPTFWFN